MNVSKITFEIEPGTGAGNLRLRARCTVDGLLYQTTLETPENTPFLHVHRHVHQQMRHAVAEKLFPTR